MIRKRFFIKKKRQIDEQRYNGLKQSDKVYIISCWKDHCPCLNQHNGCWRGFFSLFLQVIYGIRFAKHCGICCYVDFSDISYAYTDPNQNYGENNFWNYYFHQPFQNISEASIEHGILNQYMETYPLRIWSQSFYWEMHTIIQQHIHLKDEVQKIVEERKAYFSKSKILGVHIRGTDHAEEVEPVDFSVFKVLIRKNISLFDYVFVATDDGNIFNALVSEFGEKIIANDVQRSFNGNPLHAMDGAFKRYNIGLEAIIDCFCLSFCSKAFLVHSNLSYTALLINPTLSYTLLETRHHRNKRWKTLLLYYLRRIGLPTMK